jgi:hypothetical protein
MDQSKEADFTKSISNETVCTYFYVMFFIVAGIAGIAVVLDLVVMAKKPALGLQLLLRTTPTLLIAVLNALFLYIICSRSLLK